MELSKKEQNEIVASISEKFKSSQIITYDYVLNFLNAILSEKTSYDNLPINIEALKKATNSTMEISYIIQNSIYTKLCLLSGTDIEALMFLTEDKKSVATMILRKLGITDLNKVEDYLIDAFANFTGDENFNTFLTRYIMAKVKGLPFKKKSEIDAENQKKREAATPVTQPKKKKKKRRSEIASLMTPKVKNPEPAPEPAAPVPAPPPANVAPLAPDDKIPIAADSTLVEKPDDEIPKEHLPSDNIVVPAQVIPAPDKTPDALSVIPAPEEAPRNRKVTAETGNTQPNLSEDETPRYEAPREIAPESIIEIPDLVHQLSENNIQPEIPEPAQELIPEIPQEIPATMVPAPQPEAPKEKKSDVPLVSLQENQPVAPLAVPREKVPLPPQTSSSDFNSFLECQKRCGSIIGTAKPDNFVRTSQQIALVNIMGPVENHSYEMYLLLRLGFINHSFFTKQEIATILGLSITEIIIFERKTWDFIREVLSNKFNAYEEYLLTKTF